MQSNASNPATVTGKTQVTTLTNFTMPKLAFNLIPDAQMQQFASLLASGKFDSSNNHPPAGSNDNAAAG